MFLFRMDRSVSDMDLNRTQHPPPGDRRQHLIEEEDAHYYSSFYRTPPSSSNGGGSAATARRAHYEQTTSAYLDGEMADHLAAGEDRVLSAVAKAADGSRRGLWAVGAAVGFLVVLTLIDFLSRFPWKADDRSNFASPTGACDRGWIGSPDLGACYRMTPVRLPWPDAAARCDRVRRGSYLAEIASEEQMDFVEMWTSSCGANPWLGASDAKEEGVWRWHRSGEEMEDWWRMPEDSFGTYEGEDCLYFESTSSRMKDYPCNKSLLFVCQYDL